MARAIKDAVFIHGFIHFFTPSFILRYLLSTYYVPDSGLDAGVRAENNTYMVPTLLECIGETYAK